MLMSLMLTTLAAAVFGASTLQPPKKSDSVRLAVQALADQLDMDASEIVVGKVRPVQWPDSGLGCPQPGMMYAQIITPGYLVQLSAGGEVYPVHTGRGQAVVCNRDKRALGAPAARPLVPSRIQLTTDPAGGPLARLVKLVRKDLAQRLKSDPEELVLKSAESKVWPNTGLGCPQPGMMYAQVITEGFRIVFEAQGEEHPYHTDSRQSIVYCPED